VSAALSFHLPVVAEPSSRARARTRADCLPGGANASRPCAQNCRFRIERARPIASRRIHPLPPQTDSCALDVIDRDGGGVPLDVVAKALGLTRERIRQIELHALAHFRRNAFLIGITRDEIVEALREMGRAAGRVSSAHDHTSLDADTRHRRLERTRARASRGST
jgi:hypothetical protein